MTRRSRQTLTRGLGAAGLLLAMSCVAPGAASASTCSTTVNGAHSGVLNVAAGKRLCLRNALQSGAVNVSPGGGLSVRGSTITGAVTLKAGYTDLEFCASKTIGGALSASGGVGIVTIGGRGLSGLLLCGANTIDGAVTLNNNKAAVQMASTYVGGGVTASANTMRMTLAGNTIVGALTCTTNTPAPINLGIANVVIGGRSGQTCAAGTF